MENVKGLGKNGRVNHFYSSMEHYLLGVSGANWKRVRLAMVHVFIDDSGTDSAQKVAIATALIVESSRIVDLDKEVAELARKEGFLGSDGVPDFHTSECVAGNSKSLFAGWDEEKKSRVCRSMREITKKHGVNSCSIAIDRDLYDELVPLGSDLRERGGKFHYTWAVRELIKNLESWSAAHPAPMPLEYVFDWMDKGERKEEIETVMAQCAKSDPGFREDRYVFKRRAKTPGLQCADILAWTCYRFALWKVLGAPLKPIAEAGFAEFDGYRPQGVKWLMAIVQTRDQLQAWAIGNSKETAEYGKISGMSKHPFIGAYYTYTMIVGVVVGALCIYAHLFWQGGALIAAAVLFFFLGRWIDAKLKGVQSAERISLREAMKDEEE